MGKILAVGQYTEADTRALETELGAALLPSLDAIAALPPTERNGVSVVAYKGSQDFGAAVMDLLPELAGIANFGVGYDAIDMVAANARGITVTNTPGVLNDDVADLAVGMLLAQCRGFEAGIGAVRSGAWETGGDIPLGRKVSGRKVGILGLGRIGREIADRLAAFKCEIHYQSRHEKDTPGWTYHRDPVELARAVDDLVIAIVGGPDTIGLVGGRVISALGRDGVIVNIARGSVIDEAALIAALDARQLRGAALDVFRNEPRVDRRLAQSPYVLPLPHIGSATVETRAAMGILQRRNARALRDGLPPETPVN